MKFQELNAEFTRLRSLLCTFVSEDAISEISVHPPASDDEASFLRLIAWSYVLIFESGRVTIPYLLKLPSREDHSQADLQSARDLVHDLRAWHFHNLGYSTERSIAISRKVNKWFIKSCGANPPKDRKGWRSCFECLCAEVSAVLTQCQDALELAMAESGNENHIIDGLKYRLDRNWQAARFDEIVSDVTTRIGQTLDVPRFRQYRLEKWREFFETIPKHDDPEAAIVRLIERDVLNHFESMLPIDGNDIIDVIGLEPGPDVGDALSNARRLYRLGITGRGELLERLKQDF